MRSKTVAFAVLTVLYTAPAVGQGAPRDGSSGLWIGGGIGGAAGKVGCDLCRNNWKVAPTAQLRIGGTISRHLLLGVEGNGWRKNDADFGVRDIMVGIGAVLYWYPTPGSRSYYFKGGFGPIFYRAEDSDVGEGDTPDPSITSTAFGGHFGVGYDFAGRTLAVSPFFNVTASLSGSLHQSSVTLIDAGLTLVQVGMAVRWSKAP